MKRSKQRLRHVVDALLTLLTLCLMAYQAAGGAVHEWIGVAMTALLVLHHILNRRWYGPCSRADTVPGASSW